MPSSRNNEDADLPKAIRVVHIVHHPNGSVSAGLARSSCIAATRCITPDRRYSGGLVQQAGQDRCRGRSRGIGSNDRRRCRRARRHDTQDQREDHEGRPRNPGCSSEHRRSLASSEDSVGSRGSTTHGREPPALSGLEEDHDAQEERIKDEDGEKKAVHGLGGQMERCQSSVTSPRGHASVNADGRI